MLTDMRNHDFKWDSVPHTPLLACFQDDGPQDFWWQSRRDGHMEVRGCGVLSHLPLDPNDPERFNTNTTTSISLKHNTNLTTTILLGAPNTNEPHAVSNLKVIRRLPLLPKLLPPFTALFFSLGLYRS